MKLGTRPGFRVPVLDGVLDGVTAAPLPERTVKAVYFDTDDLRLARWGVTVRHRRGEGTAWTVKLPEGRDGPALVRREVSFDGPPTRIPAQALDLVRAYSRHDPLAPVAHLRTRRVALALADVEGVAVAEVVDEEVSVLHDGRVASRFREVDVEVADRAPPGLLDAVVGRLRAAGAGDPDPTPKLVRALGDRARQAPELEPVKLGPHPTAGDAVTAALVRSVTRLLRHDPGVRIGDDPEDVHQARVATRRLRSDLSTFAPLLAEDWRAPLRDELRWLGCELGAVRDADVLAARLRRQAASLPEPDVAGLAPMFRRLAKEREAAAARLAEVMAAERYVDLLDRLVAGAREPALRPGAADPARQVLVGLVARPWRQLRAAVRALPTDPADADLHQVRIRAKRTRYASDAAAAVVGRPARRFATRVADLQEVLGDHHDAVVAERWLRAAVADPDGPSPAPAAEALAAGELIAGQLAERAAGREAWPAAWKRVAKKSRRAWLG
ncbi:MAG: CHAD domain-containing protein [Acidimicrobiales bacterium]